MTYFQGQFKPRTFHRSQVVPAIPEEKFVAGEKSVRLANGQKVDVESTFKISVYSASIEFPRTTINIKCKSGTGSTYIGLSVEQWNQFTAFVRLYDDKIQAKAGDLQTIEESCKGKATELETLKSVLEMAQSYQQNTPQES